MSKQNWIEVDGIKLNLTSLAAVHGQGLEVMNIDGEEYPWIVRVQPVAADKGDLCGAPHFSKVEPLHHFVWRLRHGETNPRLPWEAIHHRNEDKMDARLKNLGKGTPAAHAKAHNARRRVHARRKRFNANGLYRPRQPEKVVPLPELVGQVVQAAPRGRRQRTREEQVRELELRLATLLPHLWEELKHLDSAQSIPRSASTAAWRSPDTRLLGIKRPRLSCSSGEVALVLLLIRHEYSLTRIGEVTGLEVGLLNDLYRRPSVGLALERWQEYKRLPQL